MVGLVMMRYIVELPGDRRCLREDLVALVGPTLQRYLAPCTP